MWFEKQIWFPCSLNIASEPFSKAVRELVYMHRPLVPSLIQIWTKFRIWLYNTRNPVFHQPTHASFQVSCHLPAYGTSRITTMMLSTKEVVNMHPMAYNRVAFLPQHRLGGCQSFHPAAPWLPHISWLPRIPASPLRHLDPDSGNQWLDPTARQEQQNAIIHVTW